MISNLFTYSLLVLYSLSFIIGGASIFLGIIYYLFERVTWLKYYLIFIVIFILIIFIRYFITYTHKLTDDFEYSSLLSNGLIFFLTLSISFTIYVVPVFLYHFSLIPLSKTGNLVYINLSIVYFILSTLGLLENKIFYIFANILLYLIIIYLFVIAIMNYKNIVDKVIKKIIKTIGTATLIIFIAVILQSIFNLYNNNDSSIFNASYMDITILLLYLWWNIVILSYFIWYFYNMLKRNYVKDINSNKKDNKDIKLLTNREKEISNYLLQGKTNKEISLILNISLNTVNNHVANIYDKVNVKNRVEFVNKIIK